jgi:hypothetical protein
MLKARLVKTPFLTQGFILYGFVLDNMLSERGSDAHDLIYMVRGRLRERNLAAPAPYGPSLQVFTEMKS